MIQKFRDTAVEMTKVNDAVVDRINDMNDEIIHAIKLAQENTENAGNSRALQQYQSILTDMRYEVRTQDKSYGGKDAIKAIQNENREMSTLLYRTCRNRTRIWKAQPITISATSQLGKAISAHN